MTIKRVQAKNSTMIHKATKYYYIIHWNILSQILELIGKKTNFTIIGSNGLLQFQQKKFTDSNTVSNQINLTIPHLHKHV